MNTFKTVFIDIVTLPSKRQKSYLKRITFNTFKFRQENELMLNLLFKVEINI